MCWDMCLNFRIFYVGVHRVDALILLFVFYRCRVSGCVGVRVACGMLFDFHWEDAYLTSVERAR